MLTDDATQLLKALTSPSDSEAARKAMADWDVQKYSNALHDLVDKVDIQRVAPSLQTKGDDRCFVLSVYIGGIVAWVVIWIILAFFELGTNANLGLFGSRGHILIFLIPPMVVALLALGSNAIFLRGGSPYSSYENEVKAIDFVERHASFFLVGSSAVFFFASFSFRDLGLRFSFPAFVIYETLSLICLSTVLLLYWFPHEDKPKTLARVRHLKTIPFTFAVGFFLAALMIITTAALPLVVP